MARITSWQSYAAGGVMSATNKSSNSPWVSPFTSSSKLYSAGRKTEEVSFYIEAEPHPCKYNKASCKYTAPPEDL